MRRVAPPDRPLAALPPVPSLAIGALGLSDQQFLGLPLPYDLASAGMPGCALLVAADVTYVLPSPGGGVSWTVDVPNAPLLVGLPLRAQGFVVDPPANALGATVTNGGRATVGF